MPILETLAVNLASSALLFFILTLIGTALWGDAALIFFVAFSVNYNIHLLIVFFAAYIGTMIGDSIWFALSMKFGHHIEKSKKLRKAYLRISQIIEVLFGKKHLLRAAYPDYL